MVNGPERRATVFSQVDQKQDPKLTNANVATPLLDVYIADCLLTNFAKSTSEVVNIRQCCVDSFFPLPAIWFE